MRALTFIVSLFLFFQWNAFSDSKVELEKVKLKEHNISTDHLILDIKLLDYDQSGNLILIRNHLTPKKVSVQKRHNVYGYDAVYDYRKNCGYDSYHCGTEERTVWRKNPDTGERQRYVEIIEKRCCWSEEYFSHWEKWHGTEVSELKLDFSKAHLLKTGETEEFLLEEGESQTLKFPKWRITPLKTVKDYKRIKTKRPFLGLIGKRAFRFKKEN